MSSSKRLPGSRSSVARAHGSTESGRRITDLDCVLARLLEIYPRDVADVWLESFNAHLGARPVDVLELSGVARVIAAIDAEAEGGYA